MKLNELVKSPETKARKRVGRGIGSGTGKTAGTGENARGFRKDLVYYIGEYQYENEDE